VEKRILIAEDDPNFGMMLKSFLMVNDFQVELCNDGNKAVSAFRSADFDLCILDVMMPFKDGFSVAETIQESGKKTPFIFLTAKAMKEDQVKGYKIGALDYLVKPFDPEILLLKVQAIINRQSASKSNTRNQFQIGKFDFESEKRTLTINEEIIKLSPKESELLHLLATNMGEVVRREDALNRIWKEDSYFTTKSMDVYITKLRKHLRKDTKNQIEITNLHGKGFVMSVQ